MINRVRHVWEELRSSLWFIPSLLALVAALLAFGMVAVDRAVGPQLRLSAPLLFEAGPEGAREVLGTIAGSVLTVAGVAFSFTILAFSLASSQYSPRVLSNFMDDRTNQMVLGMLLGSFLYCLLVLRTVRVESDSVVETTFVPSLSVTVALLIALIDLGLFIMYLHHIAVSVNAFHIVDRAGSNAVRSVERMFPEEMEQAAAAPIMDARPESGVSSRSDVRAATTGYIAELDFEGLLKLAQQHKLRVEVMLRAGEFVIEGKTLACVTAEGPLTAQARDAVGESIRGTFVLGRRRTQERDPLYGLLQLSDVAVKALSPGINDPTTALMCLDQIERVLSTAACRNEPTSVHRDSQGTPRVIAPVAGFSDLADQAFNSIRHYGVADVAVASRMLAVMAAVAARTADDARREVLRAHALAVIEAANRTVALPADRARLNAKITGLTAVARTDGWRLPLLGPVGS
jgi:uncharacterized membrane protein